MATKPIKINKVYCQTCRSLRPADTVSRGICDRCLEKKALHHNARGSKARPDIPHAISGKDLRFSLAFWDYCCAYCGKRFFSIEAVGTMNITYSILMYFDHIVPISNEKCPGTIITNIVPCCKGCNSSKFSHDLRDWVFRRRSNKAARRILKQIVDYKRIAEF